MRCRRCWLGIAFISRKQSSRFLLSTSPPAGSLRLCYHPPSTVFFANRVTRLLLLYVGSLNPPSRFNSWIRICELLNIKHFSDLPYSYSTLVQRRLRLFLLHHLLFILNKWNESGLAFLSLMLVHLLDFIGLCILQLIHIVLSFADWVRHFLKNSFFLTDLLFSNIAFADKSIVLRLIFEVTQMNFFKSFFVDNFKGIHVFNQIIFMGLQLLFNFLFLLLSLSLFLFLKPGTLDGSF